MKLLIFTASTGGGHKRAAAALKDSIQKISGGADDVKIIDGLALVGKFYNDFICDGYTALAKKAPGFYGFLYKKSNKKSMLNNFCNVVNKSKENCLLPAIQEYNPDVIISCHAFTTTMLGDLRAKGKLYTPVVAIITDFAPHYTYIAKGINHFVVSSEEMVHNIHNLYDVPLERLHSFGIPVFDKFTQVADKTQLRKSLGLDENLNTVLFMAGSFGVNEVLKFYESVVSREPQLQFIVITGKNPRLYHRFEKIINSNTKLLMFVNNVNDYMHCADIIITKPGGLTISESLHCQLPIAIYSAFPGQEADNASYLISKGAAIDISKNPGYKISTLLKNKNNLKIMSENCRKICPVNTNESIYNLVHTIADETEATTNEL